MTRMPLYPSRPFMVAVGVMFVLCGYGLWLLLGYMALTH